MIALDARFKKTTISKSVTLSPEQLPEIGPTWFLTAIKVQLSKHGMSEDSSKSKNSRKEDVSRENR